MKAANNIESEGMECPDPHRDRGIAVSTGYPLCHLSRSLVGKGQEQDTSGINTVGKQSLDTRRQRLCLAGTCRPQAEKQSLYGLLLQAADH